MAQVFWADQSIAPNTYITIQGTNLSTATSTWNTSIVGGQLPTSLNGVTVTFSSGDVLILWGTGFGASNPAVPAGVVTPSAQTYTASDSVAVTINGVQATVYGVALAPGLAGLYQVAIQVPQSLANGDWPLIATTQEGFSSASGVIVTVQN